MNLKKTTQNKYQQMSYGTYGSFTTASGTIHFLETKIKIGTTTTDPESRLTNFLRPVREVLPTKSMDFNQLLQRDLDDHRVATQLVPYLLEKNISGPAFFPPIVAALLPFNGTIPQDFFPKRTEVDVYEDELSWWNGYAFGESFKFEKMTNQNGEEHQLKFGRVLWNDEKTQLVVIDGQHRAMALLSIYRTLHSKWEGSGDKYRHFYEPVIQELFKKIPENERVDVFSKIELPVNLLWFPGIDENSTNHQKAARKLFVDVNKNARVPSPSRILLLSDSNLISILTRKALNVFRDETITLPIYAIEYDHPERDQSSSAKWSTITNVSILHSCLYRAIYGPQKYINELKSNFKGKESFAGASEFMRETLKISDIIPAVVDESDRTIKREEISDVNFPRTYVKELEEQFMKCWGHLIVRMMSDLLPFKAHGDALKELKDGWSGADSVSRLAKDSLFEGVGMYWTLRDSHSHWVEKNKILTNNGLSKLAKTDIVNALEETERKRIEFEELRAFRYLNSKSANAKAASQGAYSVYSTHACQLGFVLAVRTLALKSKVEFSRLTEYSEKIIEAANIGLSSGGGDHGRKTFIWKGHKKPFNLLPKLDTPLAVYFRYFWLELLGTVESRDVLKGFIGDEILDKCIYLSRAHYYNKIIAIYKDSLKNAHVDWKEPRLISEATKNANKDLSSALNKWFNVTDENYKTWHEEYIQKTSENDTEKVDNDNEEEQSQAENNVESVEDLLKI